MPDVSVRSKCSGVTAMCPSPIAAKSVPGLLVEAGVGPVDPVLRAPVAASP